MSLRLILMNNNDFRAFQGARQGLVVQRSWEALPHHTFGRRPRLINFPKTKPREASGCL